MVAGMAHQPALNQRGLVRAMVIQNQVYVQFSRGGGVHRVQELLELDSAMPAMTLANDSAAGHLQRGKQRRGTVTLVVVGSALHLSGSHRQQGLRAVQGLDLRLFIHAQHQGPFGRVQVEPHNVRHLLDKQRVVRELK
jgi:hypothetical protein